MRVLIFSTAYIPFIGGAEVSIREITDRLGDEIEFDLITAKLKPGLLAFERIGNVNVHRVGIGISLIDKVLFLPFIGALKAWNLHYKKPYDAFWCIMATYASGAAYIVNIFRKWKGKKQIPIILTLQEGDSEGYLTLKWGGVLHLSWKLALPRTHILTVISTYLGERAKRLGYKGRIELIPNGVDNQLFSAFPPIPELESLKLKLGKEKTDVFLVTTSRLTKKNALEDIISALTHLPEHIKFLIIGVGEDEYNLRAQVRKLDFQDRVIFKGLVPYKEIPLYLHASDVFIRPSLSEGMGNSFIEAMAASIPVIATQVGGITDFLFDPEINPDKPSTGLFAQVHNPKSIAQQVRRLLDDPPLRHMLVQNAAKLVREKYEWDLIAQEMKERVFNTLG
jgi:glycosyltransferase involved in cell wall biosynthesis